MRVDDTRQAVHEACLRMVADGLVIGSAGNISTRVDVDRFVVSAAGVPYAALTGDHHPVVEIADGSWHGTHRPTSELALHLGIMRDTLDVGAVVHTHSRHAAAFAVARLDLPFIATRASPRAPSRCW